MIRVFEPLVYEKLPYSGHLLVRGGPVFPYIEVDQKTMDAGIDQLLQGTPKERQPTVKKILQQLFPSVENDKKNDTGTQAGDWLSTARICHADLFHKYFTLFVPRTELSQVEMDELIESADDEHKLRVRFESLRNRELLDMALERLETVRKFIPQSAAQSVMNVLFDISDNLIVTFEFGSTRLGPFMSSYYLILSSLNTLTEHTAQFTALEKALSKTRGIFLPTEIVRHFEQQMKLKKPPTGYNANAKEIAMLVQLCLPRIRTAAKDGTLRASLHAKSTFWAWESWAAEEAQEWLVEQIEDAKNIPWVLSLMLESPNENGVFDIELETVAKYLDVDMLDSKSDFLVENVFEGKEKDALEAFRRALVHRGDNKN